MKNRNSKTRIYLGISKIWQEDIRVLTRHHILKTTTSCATVGTRSRISNKRNLETYNPHGQLPPHSTISRVWIGTATMTIFWRTN